MKSSFFLALVLLTACGSGDDDSNTSADGGSDATSSADGSGTTGGTSAGGTSNTGGTSSGVGTAGTSNGTGGTSNGTGGTGSVTPGDECTSVADCKLVSDCCQMCLGVPTDEPVAVCEIMCTPESGGCFSQDISEVQCRNGYCSSGVNCDLSGITCRRMQPECPDGQVTTFFFNCYGDFVDLHQCAR